jgi:hypothetical protein
LDCFWLFGGQSNTIDRIYKMNASTFVVTEHSLSATIPKWQSPSDGYFFGFYQRHVFMSSWRAIGVATSHMEPASIIRLPST